MKFTYFGCARMLGESHPRWLSSLLCLCDIYQLFVWHPSCLYGICQVFSWHLSSVCATSVCLCDICQVFVQHLSSVCLSSVCVTSVRCLYDIHQVFVWHLSNVCVTSIKYLCNIYQVLIGSLVCWFLSFWASFRFQRFVPMLKSNS